MNYSKLETQELERLEDLKRSELNSIWEQQEMNQLEIRKYEQELETLSAFRFQSIRHFEEVHSEWSDDQEFENTLSNYTQELDYNTERMMYNHETHLEQLHKERRMLDDQENDCQHELRKIVMEVM